MCNALWVSGAFHRDEGPELYQVLVFVYYCLGILLLVAVLALFINHPGHVETPHAHMHYARTQPRVRTGLSSTEYVHWMATMALLGKYGVPVDPVLPGQSSVFSLASIATFE
jgi:hypothetical protein